MLKQNYKNRFLEYLQNIKGYSKSTISTYNTAIIAILNLSDIDVENRVYHINMLGWRVSVSEQKNSTIFKKISAFRSFLKYLTLIGVKYKVSGNQTIKVGKTLPKPIQTKYIYEALERCKPIEKLIITLIYSLGLRISELENIKLSDINGKWLNVFGKGNKNRQIPINDYAFSVIKEHIHAGILGEYLLESVGKKLTQNQIRYRLKIIFKNLGVKASPHQLRHSFATDLINNGARINDVSKLLGHENLSTTQIYTQLSSTIKMDNYKQSHPIFEMSL
jgi:integrase/recombinase XerC